jgi:hypothetical protein
MPSIGTSVKPPAWCPAEQVLVHLRCPGRPWPRRGALAYRKGYAGSLRLTGSVRGDVGGQVLAARDTRGVPPSAPHAVCGAEGPTGCAPPRRRCQARSPGLVRQSPCSVGANAGTLVVATRGSSRTPCSQSTPIGRATASPDDSPAFAPVRANWLVVHELGSSGRRRIPFEMTLRVVSMRLTPHRGLPLCATSRPRLTEGSRARALRAEWRVLVRTLVNDQVKPCNQVTRSCDGIRGACVREVAATALPACSRTR